MQAAGQALLEGRLADVPHVLVGQRAAGQLGLLLEGDEDVVDVASGALLELAGSGGQASRG